MQTTATGAAFIAATAAFAFASVMAVNLSYAIAAVALSAVAIFSRLRFVKDVEATDIEARRAVLDEIIFAQEPVAVRLELVNRGHTPVKGTFEDILPEDCTLYAGDNRITATIPSRSILTVSYTIVPSRRGTHRLPGVRLVREDGLGLFTEEQMIEGGAYIGAQTKRETIDRARKMAGREHFELSGFARNPAVVLRELEFDGIREYQPGDRARDIHWKLLPKINKLMTKIYRKEGAVQTMILVDCGRSMRLESSPVSKLDHAVELAMQMSSVLISSFHPAGVAMFDELTVLDQVPPALGRHQFERIIRAVSKVPETIRASSPEARAQPPRTQAPRPAVQNGPQASEFLGKVDSLQGVRGKPRLGMEALVKSMAARSKGQQQLYIVISDLGSSRDAVMSVAQLCHRSGNKLLVIHTHDDWYRPGRETLRVEDVEMSYESMTGAIGLEAALRTLGASYVRVGPADAATGIVRAIRRGAA